MQQKRFGGRLGHGLGAVVMLGLLVLASCGNNSGNGNPGVDLGSGTLLAFIGGDGNLWLAKSDGSGAHAVTVTACPSTVNCYGPPAWSPDGQRVAVFGSSISNPSNNSIYVFNRMGLLQQTLQPSNPLANGNVLWSGDGKTIAYATDLAASSAPKGTPPQYTLVMQNVASGNQTGTIPLPSPTGGNAQCSDVPRGGPLGSYVDHAINGSNGVRSTTDWSPDGSHILSTGGDCGLQVQVVDHAGSATLLPAVSSGNGVLAQMAEFSPDGQHIVATETTPTQDDLLVYDGTGGNGKIIYSNSDKPPSFASRLSAPTWSGDGKQIFFMRGADIWVINSDGTNAQKLISGATTSDPLKDEADPQPSPDGKYLAWTEESLSTVDNMPHSALYVGDATGKHPTLVEREAIWPAWS